MWFPEPPKDQVWQASEEVLKPPKYPFVTVKLLDLLNEPYRAAYYPMLLKSCSVAARNSRFVPWGMIVKFNMKAIRLNNFHEAFLLAIEWWNVDDWWTQSQALSRQDRS
jgi:hypothetical protein